MSVLNNIKDRMEKIKNNLDENIYKITAQADVRSNRLSICTSCEFLFQPTGNCTKCGCFVKGKTWIADARCPIGKW